MTDPQTLTDPNAIMWRAEWEELVDGKVHTMTKDIYTEKAALDFARSMAAREGVCTLHYLEQPSYDGDWIVMSMKSYQGGE